jgi:hypothetical protein
MATSPGGMGCLPAEGLRLPPAGPEEPTPLAEGSPEAERAEARSASDLSASALDAPAEGTDAEDPTQPPSKTHTWTEQLWGRAEAVGHKLQEWERRWLPETRTADALERDAHASSSDSLLDGDFAPLGTGLLQRDLIDLAAPQDEIDSAPAVVPPAQVPAGGAGSAGDRAGYPGRDSDGRAEKDGGPAPSEIHVTTQSLDNHPAAAVPPLPGLAAASPRNAGGVSA